MSVRFLFALVAGFVVNATLAFAADPPAKKPDPTVALLEKLGKPVDIEKALEIPVGELGEYAAQKFGVTVILNEKALRLSQVDVKETKIKVMASKGLPVNVVLRHSLDELNATFLVRRTHIEIVPIPFAARETNNQTEDETGQARLKEPLVSVIFKEKAFNEAVAELAEENDLTVVVSPQSGDARMGFVTARLLNVPADKALELLAVQCDLRVIRKGNAYLITSRDHANEMLGERLEKERQEIEIEKLRAAPAKAPEPPEPPKPEPAKAPEAPKP